MKLRDALECFSFITASEEFLDSDLKRLEISRNFIAMVVDYHGCRHIPFYMYTPCNFSNKTKAFILRCQLEGIKVIWHE